MMEQSGFVNSRVWALLVVLVAMWRCGKAVAKETLLHPNGEHGFVVWSPDCSQVAFSVCQDERCQVWIASADGSGQRRLCAGIPLCWVEDSQRVFVLEEPCDSPLKYHTVDVESGEPGPTLEETQGCMLTLQRFPGNDRYLFVRYPSCDEENQTYDIAVTDAAGKVDRILVKGVILWRGGFGWVQLSPDGQWAAYVDGQEDEQIERALLHVVNTQTGEVRELTKGGRCLSTAWSPNSRYVACIQAEEGGGGNESPILLIDPHTGVSQQIGRTVGYDYSFDQGFALAFARQGKYLLFLRARSEGETQRLDLWARQLEGEGQDYFIAAACNAISVSPDDSRIALMRNEGLWLAEMDWDHLETREGRIRRLGGVLRRGDKNAREGAARELSWIAAPESRNSFVTALKDPDSTVRLLATRGLGVIGKLPAIAPLRPLLRDSNDSVRREAALALGQLGDREAVVPLINILPSSDLLLQGRIIELLGKLKDPRAIPALAALAEREKYEGPSYAIPGALQAIGHKSAIPILMRILRHSSMSSARGAAAGALGELGAKEAIPLLRQTAEKDAESYLRQQSAQALVKLKVPGVMELLLKLAKDPEAEVRRLVASALGEFKDERVVPTLLDLAGDSDTDTRRSTAYSLAKWMSDRRVVEILKKLANDPDHEIGEIAWEMLNELQVSVGFEALVKRLRDRDPNVRQEAIEALGKSGDKRAVPVLLPLLNDPDDEVRDAVRGALYDLPMEPFPTEEERRQIEAEPDPWKSLVVRLRLGKAVHVLGETITPEITLTNVGDKSIPSVPPVDEEGEVAEPRQWHVDVWPRGNAAPEVPQGEGVRFAHVSVTGEQYAKGEALSAREMYLRRRSLEPGKSANVAVNLFLNLSGSERELFLLAAPGRYHLRVSVNPRPYLNGPGRKWIVSNVVEFTITPRSDQLGVAFMENSERHIGELSWFTQPLGKGARPLSLLPVLDGKGRKLQIETSKVARLDTPV